MGTSRGKDFKAVKTKILNLVYLLLLLFYLGCSSNNGPQYTFTKPEGKSISEARKAVPIEGGWQFQFPEVYKVQEVSISYEGSLARIDLYSETERGWELSKSAEVQASSPLVVNLDIETDAVRMLPKPEKKGHIVFCNFKMGRRQRILSIPLKKPPFVD